MKVIQECDSLHGWQTVNVKSHSDPKVSYVVTIPPWDWDRNYGCVCECPSYEFRGTCRHQHEALQEICNWSELDSVEQTEEQKKNHICPECGGPTVIAEVCGE